MITLQSTQQIKDFFYLLNLPKVVRIIKTHKLISSIINNKNNVKLNNKLSILTKPWYNLKER